MVGVAQLVEPRIVIPVVVGSSPIIHPSFLKINLEILCGFLQDFQDILVSVIHRHVFALYNRAVLVHKSLWPELVKNAKVAELVDALDLGSSIARCESSSLSFRTILFYIDII